VFNGAVAEMAKFNPCDPEDIALKAFFIGTHSENKEFFQDQVQSLIQSWMLWRSKNYRMDGTGISNEDQASPGFKEATLRLSKIYQSLIRRFENEIPAYSPHYVSHMLSESTTPAILGHLLALLHNPNNVTRDASSVGLEIEKEAVAMLAKMLNFSDESQARGHFTSGGTLANFEALSRALKRQLHWIQSELNLNGPSANSLQRCAHRGWKTSTEKPSHFPSLVEISRRISKHWGFHWRPRVILPESAHYSWEKIVALLGLGSEALVYVPLQQDGRMDVAVLNQILKDEIQKGSTILAVVSLVGSTELGAIDAIDEIQKILDTWRIEQGIHIWHHVDAAYGGFFACCPVHELSASWHDSLKKGFQWVNSVTLDPHKLGYVPYSAGAVLVRDPRDYFLFMSDAPYIDVDRSWPGAQTIEGSRPATA
jgi:glutamate/tyrosine decarboxylase-like PLP-dependent enzyme